MQVSKEQISSAREADLADFFSEAVINVSSTEVSFMSVALADCM